MSARSRLAATTAATAESCSLLGCTVALAALVVAFFLPCAAAGEVVIRQLYGGGGNLFERDFVELFNRGDAPEPLEGLSLQYASATGTGLFSGSAPSLLSGTLAPGESLLVALAAGASGAPLPEPFLDGNPATNLAATSGKLALVRGVSGLPCNGSGAPCGPEWQAKILDLVGYGSANFFEGTAAAPPASAALALERADDGCRDTASNADDFLARPPMPRGGSSPLAPCPGGTASLELGASAVFASEVDRSLVLVTATADAPVAGPQSVSLAVLGAGVTPGDYTLVPSTLAFADGATSASASLRIVDDVLAEGSERIQLVLAGFSAGLRPGSFIHRPLVLADDDGCGLAATAIAAVQGSSVETPLAGQAVTIEAIVVESLRDGESGAVRGVFVQEEDVDADGDPASAEGLFVDDGGGGLAAGLRRGDRVRVSGVARERAGRTVLEALSSVELCTRGEPLPGAVPLALPLPGVASGDLAAAHAEIDAALEPLESMRIEVPSPLFVAESFDLARAGQLVLDAGGRARTFTDFALPSAAGFVGHQIAIARGRLLLDDGDDTADAALVGQRALAFPGPGLSLADRFRAGDRITALSGVLDGADPGVGHGGGSGAIGAGSGRWRVRVGAEAPAVVFEPVNPRPDSPPVVGGQLRLASFNVANLFETIDSTASSSSGPCGPAAALDCRGADSLAERTRQIAKLVAAICGLAPDVLGLVEVENDAGAATARLVAEASAAGCGPFAFVSTGAIGSDAIRVAIAYRPAAVEPVGAFAILDGDVDPRFDDFRNRPVLAQTFRAHASGERFTVAVAHLKSKGSSCAFLGDPDLGDGQGNCNTTRRRAAEALADWLARDPTGSGDPDFLLVGDLNAYRREDPVRALLAGADDLEGTVDDFIDLVARHAGPAAHSYVFDGQLGRLDHALASATLAPQITGAAPWAINADEPPAFDYDDPVADPGEAPFEAKPAALPLFAPDAFRTSDHDPIVIGLPEPALGQALALGLGGLALAPRRRPARARVRSIRGA